MSRSAKHPTFFLTHPADKTSLKDKITVLGVGDDDNEQVWINIRLGCKDIILGLVYGKTGISDKSEK